MIDTTNIYLFHNVYGDADQLLENKPENIIAIPFGWTEELELVRNDLLAQLNTSAPILPCIIAWKSEELVPEITTQFLNEGIKTIPAHTIDAYWACIPVGKWPKEDWTWEKINKELEKF